LRHALEKKGVFGFLTKGTSMYEGLNEKVVDACPGVSSPTRVGKKKKTKNA